MYWTMTPISSMCPSSMIVGEPPGFTSAMLLPATSDDTLSANVSASARQARAATASKPEGAGASSSRLRKETADGLSIGTLVKVVKPRYPAWPDRGRARRVDAWLAPCSCISHDQTPPCSACQKLTTCSRRRDPRHDGAPGGARLLRGGPAGCIDRPRRRHRGRPDADPPF